LQLLTGESLIASCCIQNFVTKAKETNKDLKASQQLVLGAFHKFSILFLGPMSIEWVIEKHVEELAHQDLGRLARIDKNRTFHTNTIRM